MPSSLLCYEDTAVLSLTPSPVYTVVNSMVPMAFPPFIALCKSWLCRHPLLLFIFSCVCAHMCACACACVYMYTEGRGQPRVLLLLLPAMSF